MAPSQEVILTFTIQPNDLKGEYGEFTKKDLISPAVNMFSKGWRLDDDGVARPLAETAMEVVTPWIHAVPGRDKDCGLWHQIMFDEYRILPSACMECWKVVVQPRNLKELFGLLEFQYGIPGKHAPMDLDRGCGHPCKCGIEVRPYTPKLYGGYFYSGSLDEGMECYNWVREQMSDIFDPDMKVILKRACTEFELAFGPSNLWVIPDGQLDKEDEIMDLFDRHVADNPPKQPDILIPSIKKRWVQWAFQNGDETYKLFTNGEPLYTPGVTYQDLDLSKLDIKTVEIHKQPTTHQQSTVQKQSTVSQNVTV